MPISYFEAERRREQQSSSQSASASSSSGRSSAPPPFQLRSSGPVPGTPPAQMMSGFSDSRFSYGGSTSLRPASSGSQRAANSLASGFSSIRSAMGSSSLSYRPTTPQTSNRPSGGFTSIRSAMGSSSLARNTGSSSSASRSAASSSWARQVNSNPYAGEFGVQNYRPAASLARRTHTASSPSITFNPALWGASAFQNQEPQGWYPPGPHVRPQEPQGWYPPGPHVRPEEHEGFYPPGPHVRPPEPEPEPIPEPAINGSVGATGTNHREDVELIQEELKRLGFDVDVNGQYSDELGQIISRFQRQILGGFSDGRIDPGGRSFDELLDAGTGSMSNLPPVNVIWGGAANQATVNDYALDVLSDIAEAAGTDSFRITSTARGPEAQARAMYTNLVAYGTAHQYELYGPGGDRVIDAYATASRAGLSSSEIQQAMVAAIIQVGPAAVSNHAADPDTLTVVDISTGSVQNYQAFIDAVNADDRVSRFLHPDNSNDPAFHIEIPIP